MTFAFLAIFGFLTGILASLFGFGGGFVIVPLLYRLLGTSGSHVMQIAIATSTSVMIATTALATYRHQRKGNIRWHRVFPLAFYIAIGAAIAVCLSSLFTSGQLRWLYLAYLLVTIADCLLGKTFIRQENSEQEMRSMSPPVKVFAGVLIGTIATLLGVSGSVMTVPLMRRLGAKMSEAVSLANPLSIPVAVTGAIGYAILASRMHVELGPEYLGFIYLPAFALLSVGALTGVAIGTQFMNKISDRVHARIYILLLCIVAASMLFK